MSTVIIDRVKFRNGHIMCHRPKSRKWQKAHYRQGELDGACGAYSVAILLNIMGVFEADKMREFDDLDHRTRISKLVIELNKYGLYYNGLLFSKVKRIIRKTYGTVLNVSGKTCRYGKDKLIDFVKQAIDANTPAILGINWNEDEGHWVVVIGYEMDSEKNPIGFYTLDPAESEPTSAEDLPILEIPKTLNFFYYQYPDGRRCKVDLDEAISVEDKK